MFAVCQICFQPKRKVRFSSIRLSICQWCITEICSAELSPSQVVTAYKLTSHQHRRQEVERKIAILERSRSAAPVFDQSSLVRAEQYALNSTKKSESILTSIYRTVFDDAARKLEADTLARVQQAQLTAAHFELVALHSAQEREIKSKTMLLSAELSKLPERVERDLTEYLAEAALPNPTKLIDVKLLRALELKLITFDKERLSRPESDIYEAVKREVRQQDNSQCICCQRGVDRGELHVHHIIPLYRFGTNDRKNLVTLCHPCHNKQHPEFPVSRIHPIRRAPRQQKFVAVDIETTGLSNEDSIIEIAAVLFVGGKVERVFSSLVYTKRQLPLSITRLTGITEEMLSVAPKANAAIQEFKTFIGDYRLVFHNASFDMRFIRRYADYFKWIMVNPVHCTLKIAREKLPNLPNHKLATLVAHFEIGVNRAHRATDDSIATGLLYHRLSEFTGAPRAAKRQPRRISAE